MVTEVRVGTSGYNHKHWRGSFYPLDVPQDEWLPYYASRLPAVEISNTFYRMPRREVLRLWRDTVPREFRFCVRAPRRITHQQRLAGIGRSVADLFESLAILDDRLGGVLFQLPPDQGLDLPRLDAFVKSLPAGVPAVFEFSHPSWADSRVDELLSARGHTRAVSHHDNRPLPVLPEADLLYLRLNARSYPDETLSALRRMLLARDARRAYVFCGQQENHRAPELACQLLAYFRGTPPEPQRTSPGRVEEGRRGRR